MKKNQKTKAAALLLAVLLTVPFPAGCRREEEPKPKDEYGVITADDLPENTGTTGVLTHVYKSAGDLLPEGSEIVTDGAQYDAETGTLFCVLRDGWRDYRYAEIREDAGVAREFLLPIEEDFHLRRYAVRDGKLAFDFSRTTENARGEYVTEEYLSLTDLETGETVTGEELNGFLAKDWAGSVNPIDLILDAEGDLFLLTDEQIAVFSQDLALKRVVSFQRNSPELAADPEGAVWVEYLDSKGEYVLAPFDKETGECGEELAVTGAVKSGYGSREFCFADGGELVWRDDRGVWTLRDPHADPASPELLMDWKNSCLANADVLLLWASRPDLLLIWEGYASDGEDDDTLSLWRSSEDVDLSKLRVIELANTIQMPEYVASAVVEFNKTHPDVRIAVRDYYSEYYYSNDFVYVASKLIQDILTGTYRPDIVVSKSGREDLEYFRAHSMTLDLGPYLDRDPTVNRENVFGCVQRVFATEDGGMWAIPDEFEVKTLVGPDSAIGAGNDGWTLAELLDYIESLPRDMILMQGLTKQNAASKLLGQNGYGAFFDREKGTCSFDDPLYLRWLDFLLSLPKDEAELKKSSEFERMENEEKYEIYWNGKVALSSLTISDFSSVLSPTFTFGTREWSFVGYPSDGGSPDTTVESELVFAVMSWAEEPDESWEFIRSVVSEEDGISHIRFLGMSILKSNLRKELDIADKNVYSFYFQGGRGVTGKSYWDHTPTDADLREPGKMLEFLPEDGERLLCFLDADAGESAAKNMPDQVREIIDEEVSYLLGGVGTAERCAEKIQSRVKIWMAEHE